ncbi:MAG TPA: FAD:protein FMN transferase, partial [Coriobacteriia bacterium]
MRCGPARLRATAAVTYAALAVLVAVLAASGCATRREPLTVSRTALGTVVTVTAWGSDGDALRSGAEAAFAEMTAIETELDPYSTTSTISALNADPWQWHELPASAVEVLDRVDALAVGAQFSPALFGVTKLYAFGASETVPATQTLALAVNLSRSFQRAEERAR